MLENTYLLVTSDHGELFERGIWEHLTPAMCEPLIHIPLLVARPGQQEREDVHVPTSCVDVMPTLLSLAGQLIPEWCEGEILPGFGDNEILEGCSVYGRSIYALEAKRNPKHAPLNKASVALIKGRYKLIRYFGYDGCEDRYELYDVQADPEEVRDLYASASPVAAVLRDELAEKLQAVNRLYSA